MFTELDEYNKVTADDVLRVAKMYLDEKDRTVAYTYAPAKDNSKSGDAK